MAAAPRPSVLATPRRPFGTATHSNAEMRKVYADLDNNAVFDFSSIVSAVKTFSTRFRAYTENAISNINDDKAEFDANRMEHRNQLRMLDREIEDAKASQGELWDTIAKEREQDANLRTRQQTLQAQKASVTQRCNELQAEIAELRQNLESKKQAKEARREKLKEQIDKNGPELRLLEAKTGCSVVPTKVGDQLKFTFNLMNADDWSQECHFTIDVSSSKYKLTSVSPKLEASLQESLLQELNSTRKFYTFVKKMRAALRAQVEKERLDARDAARRGGR
ncbi:Chromosome segregation protein Spc25 [Kalmanozyma brasiliensis GHG001]|uniref:Kinetochore protein SPC25 n=1 Tax=Kalmanozyma brasiliensis (strain GHG001) TaxID=1365824 RepID=V5GU85_KALBG|nr:Chromosome segregation protein Spc25 [Kalmanozyma brasiliensis GHG001]EST09472.1 Chromosome segregation protein Spc25 [Kalmanozyma brasiliensis GHG001]